MHFLKGKETRKRLAPNMDGKSIFRHICKVVWSGKWYWSSLGTRIFIFIVERQAYLYSVIIR